MKKFIHFLTIVLLSFMLLIVSLSGCYGDGNNNDNTREKTKVGVVVAVEIDAVLKKYGEAKDIETVRGYTVRTYRNDQFDLIVIDSGAGEISAATGTQLLIDRYDVDMILNFGVVGALTEEIKTAELCVVEQVIHYDFDTTGWLNLPRGQYPDKDSSYLKTTPELVAKVKQLNPELIGVICASADKFIDPADQKAALHEAYGADICEMESAGIVLTCQRNEVPVLSIKAISDSLTGGGKEFMEELERVSAICFDVVDRLIIEMFNK